MLISPNHIFLIIFITFCYDKVGGAYIYRLKISKKEDTFRDPHSIDQKKEEYKYNYMKTVNYKIVDIFLS